jgi:methylmalonyl-CoA/ethylmalonyl-CoA epimerase
MIKIKRIAHVAMAVDDIDGTASKLAAAFGLSPEGRELVASQKVETLMLPVGEAAVELIAPRGNEGVARFLDKRGPGLHHVALEVEDIEGALSHLKDLGVPLVDATPRIGAHGHKVAFVHPKATGGLLVELVQTTE